jgi:hypothetical protein
MTFQHTACVALIGFAAFVLTQVILERNGAKEFMLSSETTTFHRKPQPQQLSTNMRKFMIVHVGVPKTGTTAIQVETQHNLTKALAQDNAVWVGKWEYPLSKSFSHFQKCIISEEEATGHIRTRTVGDSCWKEHMVWEGHALVNTSSDAPNVNIVTSYEEYAYKSRKNSTMIRFQRYFEDIYNYQIVAIAGYRRYHEYVRSNTLQTYKRYCLAKGNNPAAIEWPSDGGRSCRPLWLEARPLVLSDHFRGDRWINVDELVPELRSLGMDTRVMHYHDPEYKGAITQNFYCGMLQNFAPHACKESLHMLERQKNIPRRNVGGVVYAYDAILLEAAQRGLINTTHVTRRDARNELMNHHTQTLHRGFTDLPLICPPESTMKRLLHKSLSLEQQMSMDLYGSEKVDPEVRAQHIEEFHHNVYTQRGFCSVDADKLFNNVTSYAELLHERLNQSEWGEPAVYPE